jgi:hypothetical protein
LSDAPPPFARQWLIAHRKTFINVLPPWPAPGSEDDKATNDALLNALARSRATEEEAHQATRDLTLLTNARFRDRHPALLLEAIQAIRQTHAATSGPASSREQAAQDSRQCVHCGGMGLSIRRRRDGLPWAVRTPSGHEGFLAWLTFACVCPMGRYLHAANTKDGRAPFTLLNDRLLVASTADTQDPPLSPSVATVESGIGHSINANNRHVVASAYSPSGYTSIGGDEPPF